MKLNSRVLRVALPARAAFLSLLASVNISFGASITWSGATNSLNDFNSAANWGNTSPANNDLTVSSTGAISPNLYMSAPLTINSIAFNSGDPNSSFRWGPTNSSTSAINRIITFASPTTIINLTSAANVTIAGTFTNTSTNVTSTGSMNLTLAAGASTINTDLGSTLTFADKAFISGSGTLVKSGAGTVQFTTTTNNNTFTGGLQILAGTWGIVTANHLGSSASPNADAVTINGGTLKISGTSNSGANRGFKVGSSVGTINVDTGQTFTINGTVADVTDQAGTLVKQGAGTLVLNATNSFTGGLVINAGTVSVDAVGNLGSAAAFYSNAVVIDGGTLLFTGGTSSSSANRTFRVGSNGGTIDVAADVTTKLLGDLRDVSGQSGSLTKRGTGTLILNGTSSYTGGTTVSAGTLQGDSASLKGTFVNDGAVVFDQTTPGDFAGAVSGTGSFTKSGSGTLTVSGTFSHSGATTIDAGSLSLANGTLGGSSITIAAGATLAGTGAISAPTTLSAGAYLASTNLTFNSSLDLTGIAGSGASSLLFTLTSPGASDIATVNGTLSIGNGLLTLADLNLDTAGISSVGTFTLFQSDRAIAGLLGSSGLSTTFGDYTGTLGFSGDSHALQFTVASATPIPEPSTYAAFVGAAAVAFAFYRRCRRS